MSDEKKVADPEPQQPQQQEFLKIYVPEKRDQLMIFFGYPGCEKNAEYDKIKEEVSKLKWDTKRENEYFLRPLLPNMMRLLAWVETLTHPQAVRLFNETLNHAEMMVSRYNQLLDIMRLVDEHKNKEASQRAPNTAATPLPTSGSVHDTAVKSSADGSMPSDAVIANNTDTTIAPKRKPRRSRMNELESRLDKLVNVMSNLTKRSAASLEAKIEEID